MHKPDSPGNIDGEYTEGNPFATPPIPSTTIGAKWLNTVSREIETVVTASGATLDPNNNSQLAQAILTSWKVLADVEASNAVYSIATVAMTAGLPYQFGAYFGVSRFTTAIGQQFELGLRGFYPVLKVIGELYTFGTLLYWDDVAKVVTSDGTGGLHPAGVAQVETPALSSLTVMQLLGTFAHPIVP